MTLEQIQAITDDEIRVRVAELAGWRWFKGVYVGKSAVPTEHAGPRIFFRQQDELAFDWIFDACDPPHGDKSKYIQGCPNYPADLNACHEVEMNLSAVEAVGYLDNLLEICLQAGHRAPFATARQRCEAFLAVMQP